MAREFKFGSDELMLVLVILTALMVVFQAIQINSISGAIASGKLSARPAASSVAAPSSVSGGSLPSSLNDLPSMVGGC